MASLTTTGSSVGWIFTITGGRTGTAWMTHLMHKNLGIEAIHEYKGVNDFGTRTPDIRVLRNFNTYGMNDVVKEFWSKKLAALPVESGYFEANHVLAKGGLLEALAARSDLPPITILLQRRAWVDQIVSYAVRHDFATITNLWQWFLVPDYPRRVVNPKTLLKAPGGLGAMAWYVFEIEARQEYYRLLFSDKFRFIDCQLEDVITAPGARRLLTDFGWSGEPELPAKANENKQAAPPRLRAQVKQFLSHIRFDAADVARKFVETGRRLGDHA